MVKRCSQDSGPGATPAPVRITLTINPCEPFAGRDVPFILEGLQPWQEVIVEFVDPEGRPVPWITESEAQLVNSGGDLITKRLLFSNELGRVEWLRVGTKDSEGVWSVRIAIDGQTTTVSYPVTHLQLPANQGKIYVIKLEGYPGRVSHIYYSDFVPTALVVDLQAHIDWAAVQLNQLMGLESRRIVSILLAGNQSIFEQFADTIGIEAGPEDGFLLMDVYDSRIYMRADRFRKRSEAILIHEYVHFLLDELRDTTGAPSLPAWLNEGTATYYEYVLGGKGERSEAIKAQIYRSTDLARQAAESGDLISLRQLESQSKWNSRKDSADISLQYAEAHMAVRYLTETYGDDALVAIVESMGRDRIHPIDNAMRDVFGLKFEQFEEQFVQWLKTWEDPEREEIRAYIQVLNDIMADIDAISARRTNDLTNGASLAQLVQTQRSLVSDSERLLARLEDKAPAPRLEPIHQAGLAFLGRLTQWLTLELEFSESGENSKLTQAEDMKAEIIARETLLRRRMSEVEFAYNLGGY
ncbi:MAG: hypothetical protein J4N89_09805 [Chloroflexi bacterium]|nr:hypothetical protein [Chloroflexota bacterium]